MLTWKNKEKKSFFVFAIKEIEKCNFQKMIMENWFVYEVYLFFVNIFQKICNFFDFVDDVDVVRLS